MAGEPPPSDSGDLLARARRGAGRVREELDRGAKDLSSPWPRIDPVTLEEGRAAVDRMAKALKDVSDLLDDPSDAHDSHGT